MDADLTSHHIEGMAIHGDTPFRVPLVTTVGRFQGGVLSHGGCIDGVPLDVDVIVSLYPWERFDFNGHTRLEITMYDAAGEVPEEQVKLAAQVVAFWLARGQHVVVHCQAGLNRSSLVVGYYLIHHEGMTPDDAIALIRRERSNACLCNRDFEDFLRRQA